MLVFLDRDRLINDEIWGTICISVPPLQILGGLVPPLFTPMSSSDRPDTPGFLVMILATSSQLADVTRTL